MSVFNDMNPKLVVMFLLGAIVAAGVGTYAFYKPGESPDNGNTTSSEQVEQFIEAMRAKVIAEIGQPIEGFEPFMFMQVFPGLTAQDFDGVDALIGLYRVENGQVAYDLNGEPELHSAARAISDEGMAQLYNNLLARITVMAGSDPVEAVIGAISASPGEDPTGEEGTPITVRGVITCLPHKGDGPHTMECAIGLKADNGSHYALTEFSYPDQGDVQERIEVTGTLEAPNTFNAKYDIEGSIKVEKVTKL